MRRPGWLPPLTWEDRLFITLIVGSLLALEATWQDR